MGGGWSKKRAAVGADAPGGGGSGSGGAGATTAGESASKPASMHAQGAGSFAERYRLGETLGSGAFSVVRHGWEIASERECAIKCVARKAMTATDVEFLYKEVSILQDIDHPNIVKLQDFYEENGMFYLVMERMDGGELFDRIVNKQSYSEAEARDLIKTLLEAIGYLHSRDIVHCDLKPENLLLLGPDDDTAVKLADFGFAAKLEGENSLSQPCGTPGYVAPEILNRKNYGKPVDVWSLGVICYILLCGYPPFHRDTQRELFAQIRQGSYEFHTAFWGHVSEDAKDLIRQMLVVEPSGRATAPQLLEHRWIVADATSLAGDLTGTVAELKKFNARRKLKAGMRAVMAVNRVKRIAEQAFMDREALAKAKAERQAEEAHLLGMGTIDAEAAAAAAAAAADSGGAP